MSGSDHREGYSGTSVRRAPGSHPRQDGVRSYQKGMQLKTYELFVSGIFNLIFSHHHWPRVTGITETEAVDEGFIDILHITFLYIKFKTWIRQGSLLTSTPKPVLFTDIILFPVWLCVPRFLFLHYIHTYIHICVLIYMYTCMCVLVENICCIYCIMIFGQFMYIYIFFDGHWGFCFFIFLLLQKMLHWFLCVCAYMGECILDTDHQFVTHIASIFLVYLLYSNLVMVYAVFFYVQS